MCNVAAHLSRDIIHMPPFSHSFNGQLTSKRVPIYFLSTLIHRNIEEKLTTKVILDGKDSRWVASPSAILPIQNNCLKITI
jgi:hypothetical protein